jgi:hypothetical protein
MQILLTGLTTKTITYDTTPDSTVKTLKEFIQSNYKYPPHVYSLQHGGKILDSEKTLDHYNIKDLSMIRFAVTNTVYFNTMDSYMKYTQNIESNK